MIDALRLDDPMWVQLGMALAHFLWQGALVGGVVWALLTVMRRRSPNARYAVCGLGLLVMATCPGATLWSIRSGLSSVLALGQAPPVSAGMETVNGDAVAALGNVAHLIAPNWIHYAYVAEWQAAFPDAVAWAAPGVAKRAAKKGMDLRFVHDLGAEAEAPWAGEIDQWIVEGSKVHREAVFFHRASKTLILTDLIENFEPKNLSWGMKIATWLGGIRDPDGQMPRDLRLTFSRHKAEMRKAVETMIAWRPERIIIAHGRWYEKDGTAELRRAFRWLLRDQ